MSDTTTNSEARASEKTSALLRSTLSSLTGEHVKIGVILYRLRRRSFGGLFLFFSAFGFIPGISIFAGIFMIVPAFQMAVGFRAPAFPRVVSGREIRVEGLRDIGERAIPWIERIERFVKPRWLFLTLPGFTMPLGLIVIMLAVLISLPFPGSNFLPSVSLALLALGLLERDGILIIVGLIFAAIALTIGGIIVWVAAEGIVTFYNSKL